GARRVAPGRLRGRVLGADLPALSTTWLWRSPGGAGAVARVAADVRDPNSSSSKERVESLEAARHGARGTFEATGTKRQCFTGPQKRCSGPTRIFNTGDRGVARRPRAALHSGPANEALSRLGDRRRGAFEVAFWESRIPTRAREGPCGVPRRRSPRRPRHLRSHRNQTPVFYRAPKGVLRSHQAFQYVRSRGGQTT